MWNWTTQLYLIGSHLYTTVKKRPRAGTAFLCHSPSVACTSPSTPLIPAPPLPGGDRASTTMTEYKVKNLSDLGGFTICWKNNLSFDFNKNTGCYLPNELWFTQTSAKALKERVLPTVSVRDDTSVTDLPRTGRPRQQAHSCAWSGSGGSSSLTKDDTQQLAARSLLLTLPFQVTFVHLQGLRNV